MSEPDTPKPDTPEPIRASRCPICDKLSAERFRPFCSKRCADIDLGRWLNGSYAVPAREDDEGDGERPPEPQTRAPN